MPLPRAAGLVSHARTTDLMVELVKLAAAKFERFTADTGQPLDWTRSGSLKVAMSPFFSPYGSAGETITEKVYTDFLSADVPLGSGGVSPCTGGDRRTLSIRNEVPAVPLPPMARSDFSGSGPGGKVRDPET